MPAEDGSAYDGKYKNITKRILDKKIQLIMSKKIFSRARGGIQLLSGKIQTITFC